MWKKYLIGAEGAAPIAVRFARACVEVALLAVIGFVLVELPQIDLGEFAVLSPAIVFGLLQLEGIVDQLVDPTQNRRPVRDIGPGDRGQSLSHIAIVLAALVVIVWGYVQLFGPFTVGR